MSEGSPWKGTGPSTGAKVSIVFLTLLSLASALIAVQAAAAGDALDVVGFGAGAVFLGHLVGLCITMWRHPRRVAPRAADGAVVFRYSGWTYYWMASFVVLMILTLLLIGSSFLEARDPTSIVVALASFAAAALFGLLLVRLFFGGRGRLRLTPGGLEHHGHGFTHRLAWSSVADVGPATANGSPLILVLPTASDAVDVSYASSLRIGRPRILLLPSMAIRGMWLADDPVVVYRTLWHYHANPEHRVELSTGAALDRIHQRRFLLR